MAYSAFQGNAFQSNSFQIVTSTAGEVDPGWLGGKAYAAHYPRHKKRDITEELFEKRAELERLQAAEAKKAAELSRILELEKLTAAKQKKVYGLEADLASINAEEMRLSAEISLLEDLKIKRYMDEEDAILAIMLSSPF